MTKFAHLSKKPNKNLAKRKKIFKFKAEIWIYPGVQGAWHFLSLPKKESTKIKKMFGEQSHGWGSLPVDVTIGQTTWKTSIFPNKKSASYILPLKSEVRKKEKIEVGSKTNCVVKIKV